MSWFLIYIFVIADQIRDAVSGYGGAFFLAFIVTAVCFGIIGCMRASIDIETRSPEQFDARWDKVKVGVLSWIKRVLVIFWIIPLLMWTLHTFLPSQKNLAILIASGVTYEAITSESGKRIGGKVIQMLEQKMDEALHKEKEIEQEKEIKEETKTST